MSVMIIVLVITDCNIVQMPKSENALPLFSTSPPAECVDALRPIPLESVRLVLTARRCRSCFISISFNDHNKGLVVEI